MSNPQTESLAYGGQALIEGVMMRSNTHMVLCVRQPDNQITTEVLRLNSRTKNRILGLPFIRGIVMLLETMYYGMKSLIHSANIALEEEDESFTTFDYILLIGMVLLINGIFIAIPFFLTNYLGLKGIIFNVVESGLRLSMFILYLYLISRWSEVARVLQYHGAEHKAINAYEAGVELEPEMVSKFSRLNPRCGTSFLFFTVLISIALFSLIPRTTFLLRLGYRLLLIPAIASISYELLKLSDRYRGNPVIKALISPGMLFQKLTTKEPELDMIQVAVQALEKVINIDT
jgi:uncharacterized protein YqhQ